MEIAKQIEPIQWVSTFVLIVTVSFIGYTIVRKQQGLFSMPFLLLTIHGLIFYLVLTLQRLGALHTGIKFTTWSSILRLHSYLTVAMFIFTDWYLKRYINAKRKS